MDVYLPNEFYELRSDLPDWSDAATEMPHRSEARDDSADPNWQVI
jgi:hypothetical protein